MLKCLTLFLLAFFFGSLAFQKNPSHFQLTWSREKKLKDMVAVLALIFLRQMIWFVSGWMAIIYWLYELPFFSCFKNGKQKSLFNPWTSSLFRLPIPLNVGERKEREVEKSISLLSSLRADFLRHLRPGSNELWSLFGSDLKLRTFKRRPKTMTSVEKKAGFDGFWWHTCEQTTFQVGLPLLKGWRCP